MICRVCGYDDLGRGEFPDLELRQGEKLSVRFPDMGFPLSVDVKVCPSCGGVQVVSEFLKKRDHPISDSSQL